MKHDQRHVERADQPGQVVEHAEPAAADRIGDGRADADRRIAHDDVGEAEHRLGQRLAPRDHRPALLADHAERDREDQAEDDDLQHVAARHGVDDRLGHGVQQHLIPGLRGSVDRPLPAAGSEIPSPGRVMFTANRPISSAIVVTTSK